MFEVTPQPPGDDSSGLPDWLNVDLYDLEEFVDETGAGHSVVLAAVAGREVGPSLLAGLINVPVAALSPDDAVTFLQQWERAAAWLAGKQVEVTAEAFRVLVDNAPASESAGSAFASAEMTASAEAAAALRIAPRTADARVFQALDLVGPMAPLHEALVGGTLSASHASAIRRELLRLPTAGNPALVEEFTDHCASVLADVIPFAARHTPGQAAKRTRMLVSAVDPAAVRERRREVAEREHGVFQGGSGSALLERTGPRSAHVPDRGGTDNAPGYDPEPLGLGDHRRHTHRVGPSARRAD